MKGQLSIFDWMPDAVETPDINSITEAEAVQIVGDRIGVQFTYNSFFDEHQGKKGKMKLGLKYDHFAPGVRNGELFLGTSYQIGTSGGGSPCSGIDDAVKWFKEVLKRNGI